VILAHPVTGDFHPAFQRYVDRVTEGDVMAALAAQVADVRAALGAVPAERESYRYQDGKWSVRQVLGHVVDTERMFGYRMLCIGRGDTQNLPGFDEDPYAAAAGHDRVRLADLLEEFDLVRRANVLLARGFDDLAWARVGTANGNRIVTRACPYIMVGHVRHHLAVLASKYGIPR
jgi:hypothetical protein